MQEASLVFILLCLKLWFLEFTAAVLLEDAEISDVSAVLLRLEDEKEKRILLNNDVEVLMLKVARLERQMIQVLQKHPVVSASGGLTGANRSQCPSNYTLHAQLKLCFRLSKEKQNWETARQVCESDGGHLAKVNTTEIQLYLKEQIKNSRYIPKGSHVFIDGNDREEEGIWRWADRELIDMKSPVWYPGEPQGGERENCMLLYSPVDYGVVDAACSLMLYYICQIG
ncbi:hypothetical protein CHS0354_004106 [Potamilus streckersoni]|uniref:C-type lectin domain-containing protein n=1 Tax=Potamilus streckersoni TaxID=2493646 RepID=A0AAE0SK58_9BIVA|nr:hypothetical protein CHS0354_004106 [Potamilus streckersoni]